MLFDRRDLALGPGDGEETLDQLRVVAGNAHWRQLGVTRAPWAVELIRVGQLALQRLDRLLGGSQTAARGLAVDLDRLDLASLVEQIADPVAD